MDSQQEPLLDVQGLSTSIFTADGVVKPVQDVSFSIRPGEVLGIVGESGSGKTTLALSILGIISYPARIIAGSVFFKGKDLLEASESELRGVRGHEIAMVFQDAISSLNPLLTVGDQVTEILLAHTDMSKSAAETRAMDILHEAGLPDPRNVMKSYPFQLSGGMCQRVMVGMMLSLEPALLIADEPTSALDTTLQAEMLERINTLRRRKGTAVILITHSLGVIARVADRVMVMYGGRVMEQAETPVIFERPAHPYTWALLSAIPRLDAPQRPLRPLRGTPPDLMDPPDECPFLARCNKATAACRTSSMPPLEEIEPDHLTACYNPMWLGNQQIR